MKESNTRIFLNYSLIYVLHINKSCIAVVFCLFENGFLYIDETGGIVVDIGSSLIKMGYGGEDMPKAVYPSVSYF